MLCILAIALLLGYSLRPDLLCVPDPQFKVQLRQQPFKPARMPTGFHSHTHFHSRCRKSTVELLRFLTVFHSSFVPLASFSINKRNLLEARVVVTTYKDHLRLLSPEPLVGWRHQSLLGLGADIVMESITLNDQQLQVRQTSKHCM